MGQETIATRAYRLWEEAGRPEGQDQEFWFRAEREVNVTVNEPAKQGRLVSASAPSRSGARGRRLSA